MPQQELEPLLEYQPIKQEPQQPRFGGGGSGGGGDGRRDSDFSPKEVSQIFEFLQNANDKYFRKNSRQPIPEDAIRELNHVIFSVIRKSTGDKKRLLNLLQQMEAQAEAERRDRGTDLTAEQTGDLIGRTIKKIIKCFVPTLPDE